MRAGTSPRRVLGVALVAAACGGSGTSPGGPPGPGPVATIRVSPGTLTLRVGGQGTLAAMVLDANGLAVPGVTPAWTSRNALVAAVDNAGGVTGVVVGQTFVVATAAGSADSALVTVLDSLSLEVVPAAATVAVGGAVQFNAIARNSSGQVVATPPLAWTSSSPGVAVISGTGLALGVTRGTAAITAAGGGATSPPATLTVTDAAAAPCDGITNVDAFSGTMDYVYGANAVTPNGDWRIVAQYRGDVSATLTRQGVWVPGITTQIWTGPLVGTASITETQTDVAAGSVTRLDGGGALVMQPPALVPTFSLIVDLTSCTYRLTALTALELTRTESDGRRTSSSALAAGVYLAGTLGAWRSAGIFAAFETAAGHSAIWALLNPRANAFVPLGLAVQLMQGHGGEPPAGEATINYRLTPR